MVSNDCFRKVRRNGSGFFLSFQDRRFYCNRGFSPRLDEQKPSEALVILGKTLLKPGFKSASSPQGAHRWRRAFQCPVFQTRLILYLLGEAPCLVAAQRTGQDYGNAPRRFSPKRQGLLPVHSLDPVGLPAMHRIGSTKIGTLCLVCQETNYVTMVLVFLVS